MGIVSAAKGCFSEIPKRVASVSIPDGDSFRREALCIGAFAASRMFQSPMGIVSAAKPGKRNGRKCPDGVSIPDGDSFRREVRRLFAYLDSNLGFNPRWG